MLGYFEFFLPQSMNEKFNNLIDKNKIYTDYLSGIFATLLANSM